MSTVGMLAIIAIGASGVIYSVRRLHHQRQVLQWFYTRQSHQLTTQSEKIREQLLQETFALRRAIELGSTSTHVSSQQRSEQQAQQLEQQWKSCLALTQNFNQSLENLSNELSPPFIEDSLPLALQHLIKQWQRHQTTTQPQFDLQFDLQLDLPAVWPQQQPDRNRMVLWCVHECLQMLPPNQRQTEHQTERQTDPATISLHLMETDGTAQLQLSWDQRLLESMTINSFHNESFHNELMQVQHIFQLLMPGRCRILYAETRVSCEFSWALNRSLVQIDWSQ